MSPFHRHLGRRGWDRLGIFASAACLVHCLALPLLIPLLPMLALVPHGAVHVALLLPIVAISLLAVIPGFRQHRARRVPVLALLGVCLCTAAVLADSVFGIEALDAPLTATGGLSLVSAHLLNIHLARRRNCDRCAA